ncbi:MAG TPA: hypothetical protein VFP56_00385 [Candidatus Limnocylindrales bacterium]|nr:hypothetical protein [Candidatus Limnocylindrales bacterium]
MPAETMISILAATLLATGWALWFLPVGTCAQCAHCRAEGAATARESDVQLSGVYGIPTCPSCGRHHRRGEDHRS